MKQLPPSRGDAEPPIIYVPSSQAQSARRSSFFRTCLLLALGAFAACALMAGVLFVLREQIFPPTTPPANETNTTAAVAALTAQAQTNQQLATLQAESAQGKATIQALQTAAAQGNSDTPANTREPSATEMPSTNAVESKCKWAVQAYNASDPNDLNQIFVNGVSVIQQPDANGMLQDTAWLNIGNRVVEGKDNIVRFAAYSQDEKASWGFRIRRDSEILVDERGASPSGETGGVFDAAYRLTDNCQVQQLQPTGDAWVIEGEYDNWAGANIFIDGAQIRAFGNKEPDGTFSYDISPWIREQQKTQISIRGEDYASMNGGTVFTFRVVKNGQIVFSKTLNEQSEAFQSFPLYILPDGRVSLDGK